MPQPGVVAPSHVAALRSIVFRVVLAAVTGALWGGLTSFGQEALPTGITSLANSVTGWTIPTFLVVMSCTLAPVARRPWLAAVMGGVCFHLMLQGYAVVSTARGFPDSYGPENVFFWAATFCGPIVGLSAVWQYSASPNLRGAGLAVITAVLLGEGSHGLASLTATTGWIYWALDLLLGAVVLTVVIPCRVQPWAARLSAMALALAGGALFFVGTEAVSAASGT